MSTKENWVIRAVISEEIKQQFPEIHPVLLQLLWNRGIQSQTEMTTYLSPDWQRDSYVHTQFSNMFRAVACVFLALEQGKVICVHGDYDADGVCGSAVLLSTLREVCRWLGYDESKITFYIPHREKEGYGMSVETVEMLHQTRQISVIITVDCGISNKPAIDRAKELGIETIVCDHHTIPTELPEQAILIHPLVPGETYPNKKLCGTGVAFKFACGLIHEAQTRGASIPEGYEKWLLDLVAIATVTDVMPLQGENRVLEHFGLKVLNKTRRFGLQKLVEIAGGTMGSLDVTSIGFMIGPRLNAAGRMSHAQEALNLLLSEDELEAVTLAMQLQETNIQRQKASQKMYEEAKKQVDPLSKLIVVIGEGWSAGLVGLVAGKLVNEYGKPVYAIGKIGETYTGSGRGVNGFDVTEALRRAQHHLDKFGGHPEACGFSTTGSDRMQAAMRLFHDFAKEMIPQTPSGPPLLIDVQMPLDQVTWDVWALIEQCRPFGQGNPSPVFCTQNVRVVQMRTVGAKEQHLKLTVADQTGRKIPAIGFGLGAEIEHLSLGCLADLVYEIDVNEWKGNRDLQLHLKAIHLSTGISVKLMDFR